MPPVGLELTISAGERLQKNSLDRAATGTGKHIDLKDSYSNVTVYRVFMQNVN
jgi:hypothetical protein